MGYGNTILRIIIMISAISMIYSGIVRAVNLAMGLRPPVASYPLLGFIDTPPAVGVLSFLVIGSLLTVLTVFPKLSSDYIFNRSKPWWIVVSALLIVFGIGELRLFAGVAPRLFDPGVVLSPAPFPGWPFPGGRLFHFVFQHFLGGSFAVLVGAYPKILRAVVRIIAVPARVKA